MNRMKDWIGGYELYGVLRWMLSSYSAQFNMSVADKNKELKQPCGDSRLCQDITWWCHMILNSENNMSLVFCFYPYAPPKLLLQLPSGTQSLFCWWELPWVNITHFNTETYACEPYILNTRACGYKYRDLKCTIYEFNDTVTLECCLSISLVDRESACHYYIDLSKYQGR